jgi:alkylation response protein AidB-like acyl-CoA dehydrogenase
MHFAFDADQLAMAAGLRDMLDREFTPAALRAVWDAGTGQDPALWARLADMGVFGVLTSEADGGWGGTMIDAVLLCHELGRAAAPGPVLETMTIAATALAGTPLATGAAAGVTTVTAVLDGGRYVPHCNAATVTVTPVESLDHGRLLATVTDAEHVGRHIGVDLELLRDIGALATAAYLDGLSTRMLAIAGDYARDRRQFGQPIGSFQAVKHLMADALLQVEFARPAIHRAAWSISVDHPDRARDVSMAKALANDAAQKAARSALQVHGAIGYTWECDLHLYMKKAWALIPACGTAIHHRRRVADAVLGARPTLA